MISPIFIKTIKLNILLKNNNYYIYIFKKNKKIIFIINNYIHLNLKFIFFFLIKIKNIKNLYNFFFLWTNYFVKKIKVRHKISWLKIFRKKYFLIKINYGFSFKAIFFLNNLFLKKKKKYLTFSNIIFWNLNLISLYKTVFNIRKYKLFNQYTMRGFKFSQQKYIKRVGKISKFTEFKSKIF
jgi:hypothetical protein